MEIRERSSRNQIFFFALVFFAQDARPTFPSRPALGLRTSSSLDVRSGPKPSASLRRASYHPLEASAFAYSNHSRFASASVPCHLSRRHADFREERTGRTSNQPRSWHGLPDDPASELPVPSERLPESAPRRALHTRLLRDSHLGLDLGHYVGSPLTIPSVVRSFLPLRSEGGRKRTE